MSKGFEVEDDKDTQEWSEGSALGEFEALKKRLKEAAEAERKSKLPSPQEAPKTSA